MSKQTQQTYQQAYQTLKDNAETLQNSDGVDIDQLMDIVSESIDAYQFCQARIAAVEKAINSSFEQVHDLATSDS